MNNRFVIKPGADRKWGWKFYAGASLVAKSVERYDSIVLAEAAIAKVRDPNATIRRDDIPEPNQPDAGGA